MSSTAGDCFVVLTPHSEENSVIFGRNSIPSIDCEVQEVDYIPAQDNANALILSKRANIWGGESGANNKDVCMGITWCDCDDNYEQSTEFVRKTLECSSSAEEAVSIAGSFVSESGNNSSKYNFVICDSKEAWLLSTGGKLWAAEQITNGFRKINGNCLTVTTKIDKSSDNLGDELKNSDLWDGSGDLDFAKSFSASPTDDTWPGAALKEDGSFSLTDIFEILRTSAPDAAGSSHVSVLVSPGFSCHWFTATPNPKESVFKPFVFVPNSKISPLTKIPADDAADNEITTLLHKLHAQRNWESVGSLLKSLESTCVDEVKKFLSEHPTPNPELDELMKDCVEAEVKFYR